MLSSLRNKLYQSILQIKKELEDARKEGEKVDLDYDLPRVAAGCEYAGMECCGFSHHSNHIKRPDIRKPFSPLLETALKAQQPGLKKLPSVVFKPKRIRIFNYQNGETRFIREVEKYIGTCAEDNAANNVLYNLAIQQRPSSLKQLNFMHPIRPRTMKRIRMCGVCQNLFTEP